jgi:hypothetical protein
MFGFDATDVRTLSITLSGSSPSGAIDNLVFVPGPSVMTLLLVALAIGWRRRG